MAPSVSRGLGEAIVHRLSQAGASVVLTGRGLG
jgi:NAD(P)-dependent dehydrogenase (short-subunit alcohol dehydrogenase family)